MPASRAAMGEDTYGTGTNWETPPADATSAAADATYIGTYHNDYYGDVEIARGADGLVLRTGPKPLAFPLTHYDRDTFPGIRRGRMPQGTADFPSRSSRTEKLSHSATTTWRWTRQGSCCDPRERLLLGEETASAGVWAWFARRPARRDAKTELFPQAEASTGAPPSRRDGPIGQRPDRCHHEHQGTDGQRPVHYADRSPWHAPPHPPPPQRPDRGRRCHDAEYEATDVRHVRQRRTL